MNHVQYGTVRYGTPCTACTACIVCIVQHDSMYCTACNVQCEYAQYVQYLQHVRDVRKYLVPCTQYVVPNILNIFKHCEILTAFDNTTVTYNKSKHVVANNSKVAASSSRRKQCLGAPIHIKMWFLLIHIQNCM